MARFPQGEAHDVVTAEEATAAAERLSSAPEVAVDVEADAMHAFRARLCFVQVGTDEDIFLFDSLKLSGEERALRDVFEDPSQTKFFHAAGGDLAFLAEAGLKVRCLFDTHRAATLLGWQKVGLADLARERLGVELKKEHQQSDFSLRPLPPEMREYIADDVRYLVEIGRQVRAECAKADILEEVLLDCERLAEEAVERPAEGAEFRPKLPRGQLRPKELALAQAVAKTLHEKRLAWAEAANVPMGRMLSNAAVTALAVRPPGSLKELQRAEGVRGAFVREHGEEVLALVRELVEKSREGGLEPEPEAADKGAKDPGRRKRVDALTQWRKDKAHQRRVTPSVVLPNALVEELAQAAPTDTDGLRALKYLGEKRVRMYGEELLELLRKSGS